MLGPVMICSRSLRHRGGRRWGRSGPPRQALDDRVPAVLDIDGHRRVDVRARVVVAVSDLGERRGDVPLREAGASLRIASPCRPASRTSLA